jgi:DNA-binding transcriptional regulator YhcF (GntR family)
VAERGGFIVLWRKALDGWLFDLPPGQFKVAIRLLHDANWKDSSALRGGQRITIQRGQALVSQHGLAESCGVSRNTVRRALEVLEGAEFITTERTKHHTVVTVVNYSKYQDVPDDSHQRMATSLASGVANALANGLAISEQGNKGTREQEDTSEAPPRTPTPPKPEKVWPHEAKRIAWDLSGLIARRLPESKEARPDVREANARRWCDPVEKLHRIDGHPWERIADVMRWSQADDFWSGNVLSGTALRKQFTKLQAAMRGRTSSPTNDPATYRYHDLDAKEPNA